MCQNKKCICPNSKMKSYGIRLMPFLTVRRFCRLPSNKIILDQLCPNFKKKLVVLISKCICPNRKCICPNRKIKSSALFGCQTVVPGKKILDQLTSVGCCRRMRLQEISRGKYQKYNWTKHKETKLDKLEEKLDTVGTTVLSLSNSQGPPSQFHIYSLFHHAIV